MAAARVLEGRAQLGIARASQFPQLSAGSSYANERPYSANSFFLRGLPGPPTGDDLQANFDLTFEFDLWGRLRRATEAARADLLASEENARIGEAETEFFSKISLTGMFGVESVSLSSLSSGASWYGTPDPQ